jgi:hypothetical protein
MGQEHKCGRYLKQNGEKNDIASCFVLILFVVLNLFLGL